MLRRIITEEILNFMVEVVEIAAAGFYENDRAAAFKGLNDKMIWHHFVEKYEEKRNLPKGEILSQIGKMLGMNEPPAIDAESLKAGDTDLIREAVRRIGKKYNWNYSVSLERFYTSDALKMALGAKTGLSASGVDEIIESFGRSMAE